MTTETKKKLNFCTDMLLIIPFFSLIFSGFIIQIFYHMKKYDSIVSVLGWNRVDWLLFHKICVIFVVPLILFHLIMHYKWFAGVIKKNLFINGNKQVKRTFRLFIIFIFTALTGLIPWVFGFTQEARFMMVEIHDKLAIFCTFYFLYHFAVRHNWLGDYVRSKRKNTDLKVEIYSEE